MEETYDIFVGSLLSCVTQESLTKLFEKFGKIVKVRVLEKTSAKGLKFAFVHFTEEDAALRAIEEMSDFMFNGVPLQVRKSDRWLKRTGEEKSAPKGNFIKKLNSNKSSSSSSENIGVWEPPQLVSSSTGAKHFEKTSGPPVAIQVSAPKPSQNKILNESIAVTHVEDPVTFFAYFASKNPELDILTRELQEMCPTLSPIVGEPKVNQVYASVYSADKQWYRCRVIQIDSSLSRSLVQYIDFGNVEKVSNMQLVDLPPRMQIISPFTMKCILKNLVPTPNNPTRFEEALNFLKSLLIDNIVTAVLHVVGNGNCLQVSEIKHNGVNIVDLMIKKDFIVHSASIDSNRNCPARNGKVPTSISPGNQGLLNNKSRKPQVPEVKATNANYNNIMFNQERAQLLAENKKLKFDFAQAMGKNKALETELHAVNRSLAEPNPFTELPSVIYDIEKVRLLRQQFPLRPNSIDYIDKAVALLKEFDNGLKPLDKQYRERIQNNVAEYYNMQENILDCLVQEELPKLIEERNQLQNTLSEELTTFCKAVHSDEVQERLQTIKLVLAELKSIYQPFLRMKTFSQTAMPMEELHNFYVCAKNEKASKFLEVQKKTNVAHRNFFKALQPASQNLEQTHVPGTSMSEVTTALTELKICLTEEVSVCSVEDTPEASILGVISHLLCDRLEQEIVSTEEIGFYEKQYKSLLGNLSLSEVSFPPPEVLQLTEKRKERKKLKSQLRHILADKMDLEENEEASESETSKINSRLSEVRCELHKTFIEEDKLIASIAHLQEKVFPELNNLYPDLGLREYNKYKGTMKPGLEIEHFDLQPLESTIPSKTLYISSFMGTPVRLQECQLSSDLEKEDLMECIVQYSAISHPNLLPVNAVFFTKKFILAYVQQPLLRTLQSFVEENKQLHPVKIIFILKGILQVLSALNARGLVHGNLHPATIFISTDGEPVLDSLSFQPHKPCGTLPVVNGISFQCPRMGNNPSFNHDMFAFSCLCLWLMYPQHEFHLNASGKPLLQDLPLDASRVEILKLVNMIFESSTSGIQACDILNHPALNSDPDSFNILEVPDIPDACSDLPSLEESALTNQNEVPLDDCENRIMLPSVKVKTEESQATDFDIGVEEDESSEEESDNLQHILQAYDSIRLNQCSLGLSESTPNI